MIDYAETVLALLMLLASVRTAGWGLDRLREACDDPSTGTGLWQEDQAERG
jgi:hypothetical protein